MHQAALAAVMALSVAACSVVEHTTVVAADNPCSRYGFAAASADYARCREQIVVQRQLVRVAPSYGDARIVADAQAACAGYGVPRGTAQYDLCVKDEFAARRPG